MFIFGFILYDILRLASMLRLCRGFGAVRGCHDVKALLSGLDLLHEALDVKMVTMTDVLLRCVRGAPLYLRP